jgi:hypothetical protein
VLHYAISLNEHRLEDDLELPPLSPSERRRWRRYLAFHYREWTRMIENYSAPTCVCPCGCKSELSREVARLTTERCGGATVQGVLLRPCVRFWVASIR